MSNEKPTEEVGFGRPPKQHQFKPGKSGNPRGRPKKAGRKPKPGEIDVAGILNGDRTVRTAQGEQRMSGFEILCRAEVMYALKGDVRAAIRFIKRCETHDIIWTPPRRKMYGTIDYPPGATKEEIERQLWEEKPKKRKLTENKAGQAAVLETVAYEQHKVAQGKKRYAIELVLELIANNAFAGNVGAARMFEQLSAKYCAPAVAGAGGGFLITPGMATNIDEFNKMADEQQRQFREPQDYEKLYNAARGRPERDV